jgi:hypothetical protein
MVTHGVARRQSLRRRVSCSRGRAGFVPDSKAYAVDIALLGDANGLAIGNAVSHFSTRTAGDNVRDAEGFAGARRDP